MNCWIKRRLGLLVLVLGVALALGTVSACDDDTPPPVKQDKGTDTYQQQDTSIWPDLNQPDQYVWPDQGADKTIWPDTYSSGPFGCQADSDCFGLKCCPTPWGVKLCAPTCK